MKRLVQFVAVLVLTSIACNAPQSGASNTPPISTISIPDDQVAPTEVTTYLLDLPDWETFSPPLTEQEPTAVGNPLPEGDPVTVESPLRNEDGSIARDENGSPTGYEQVTYTCTTTPYSLTSTPEQIVMYNPDASVLWPGALIQGTSYADGRGSLLALPIAERAPISVTIPDFFNDDPSRIVENPSLDSVTRAVNAMVGNANAEGLATPSAITFEMRTYNSEADFAASFDVSGRYLGFEGSASGDYESSESENTVAVHFYQQMFTVVVPPPQTPGAFFSNEFTEARLQEQVGLGRIGPDNLPVYVSEVVYGRMMMFTMTSTASEEEIRGTLNAAYNSIGTNVEANLSASQRSLLQESKIAITSYGGDSAATIAMIQSGDWSQYFTDTAPLTTAKPLSYTFRTLDGRIAQVSEAWDYSVRECKGRAANAGIFDFLPLQPADTLGIDTPYEAHTGDMNGDGLIDLIFNHKSATSNQTVIGLANGDGTFTFGDVISHPGDTVWTSAVTLVGDISGDGIDDIVWNVLTPTTNILYPALANSNGGLGIQNGTLNPDTLSPWEQFDVYLADNNGDGRQDIYWVKEQPVLSTAIALSGGDGTFDINERTNYDDRDIESEFLPTTHIGDFNGDGRDDLTWYFTASRDGGGRSTYTLVSDGNGKLTDQGSYFFWPYFSSVRMHVGDVNGDGLQDFIWNNIQTGNNRSYFGLGQANGSVGWDDFRIADHPAEEEWQFYNAYIADFNGDGRDDILFNDLRDTYNRMYVGMASSSNVIFDYSNAGQTHPLTDQWSTAVTLTGDVTGDRLDDVIWVFTTPAPRIIVGQALP